MSSILTERMVYGLLNALLIVLVIPIVGYIINIITRFLVKIISNFFGRGFALFVANYLSFIGVMHHELSHALFALLTGAKVNNISLFHPEGESLGKVEMSPRGNFLIRSIQLTMAAIAPVVMGTVTEYLLYRFAIPWASEIWQQVLVIYVMVSIFLHMTMSKPDIKNALKGLPICFIIIFLVIYVTGFNILPFEINIS